MRIHLALTSSGVTWSKSSRGFTVVNPFKTILHTKYGGMFLYQYKCNINQSFKILLEIYFDYKW